MFTITCPSPRRSAQNRTSALLHAGTWCWQYCEKGADSPSNATCLQALLEEWRSELARKPMSMSEAEACQVLQYVTGEDGLDEDALKAAYRKMARK